MNRCSACGKETSNSKYCSLSCCAQQPRIKKDKTRFCQECGTEYQYTSKQQKYCSRKCSVTANNRARSNGEPTTCLQCGICTSNRKYCSTNCTSLAVREAMVTKFLSGEIDSINLKSLGVRSYILQRQNGKCLLCGIESMWNGKPIVFVLDHEDGNSANHQSKNVRLVCPNCDSQLPTFKSKNKGNGRHSRRQRYLAGKSY